MSTPVWLAAWGVSSVALAFVAAFACIVAMIWNLDTSLKISGSVVAFALFSLFAALFEQSVIDRQASQDHPTQPTVKEPR